MASSNNNLLTKNYSGTVGKQFSFRTRGGKSIIAALPKARSVDFLNQPAQLAIQKKFKLAAIYARKVNTNPALMEQYALARKDGQTAFNIAFSDAYKGPELSDLRIDGYTGEIGQKLVVNAVDNFRVATVKFSILAADGTVLEEGVAIEDENGYDWAYTTKKVNPSLPGTIIRITAEDIPKNQALLEAKL